MRMADVRFPCGVRTCQALFGALMVGLGLVTGCGPGPSVEQGREAFVAECARCHSSGDGWDLAFFGFPDESIVRRAEKHVDTGTAHSIVAYVRSLGVQPAAPDFRPFQPGGRVLPSDEAFALELFGEDRWPHELTREQLLAFNPRELAVAFPFLPWSNEESRTDWLPDEPLPEALLTERDGALEALLDTYAARRDTESLLAALALFRELTEGPEDSTRICAGVEGFLPRPEQCFQARRWMAALAGQHFLRHGLEAEVPLEVIDLWWDVGGADVTTMSRTPERRREYAESAVSWMYLAWTLDPLRKDDNDAYFPMALKALELRRHLTFAMLYTAALDPAGWDGTRPYSQVLQVIDRTPPHWAYDAVRWGLTLLATYQETGTLPTSEQARAQALQLVDIARRLIDDDWRGVYSAEQKSELLGLCDQLTARLQQP